MGGNVWQGGSQTGVTKIGYSVYDPTELDRLGLLDYPVRCNCPLTGSISFFAASGWTRRLREAGCEVHARSIFPQGVLLQDAVSRAAYFDHWSDAFDRFDGAKGKLLVARQGSLLSHWPSRTVTSVGWCVASTVRASFHNYATGLTVQPLLSTLPDLIVSDARLILPQNWQLGS